ncbi:hypothetical protein RB25_13570 [Herbaspirillum rubrisubalbicans]|uniref:Acyl-protein synthetase LuxE domain-containing protein n=1 Tax=Herbaspirillum rubrisubalbicans TaxID=80842 RepID=A0ABX9C851_9BURK|nr:hypothetical protein [Herbaspirillum rubrisubalbicans]MCP1572933.1 hypothetical protein [Herbaspirillum rubrisubalbicans]RAM66781.1 hypothetical protein RB24_00265 [Herbaspirillum rubrisubalbicans]RAN47440.1 hypothetical protein RB25_13570 [Herbaspirillum rubrisubalbicans]
MTALEQILKLTTIDDPFRNAPSNLYQLQLEAAAERFAQRREQIPVLKIRARDSGVEAVRSHADLVPLLFADANYKSYPDSFVEQGRWDRMSLWLQTLSTHPIKGIDYAGINNMDDWIYALRKNGHHVMSSSGTSGRNSFLNQSEVDREMGWRLMEQGIRWCVGRFRDKEKRYPVFLLLPAQGSYTATERTARFAEEIGLDGDIHYISNVPQSATEMMQMMQLRRAMAAGTAKPSEIAEAEERGRARQQRIAEDMAGFIDQLLARRHEPMIITGMMAMLYAVVAAARARGIPDGDFHPDTIISIGGGKKGNALPDDYQQQCYDFFKLGPENFCDGYGMAEMSGFCPTWHSQGGWVIPPWILPLVLDQAGEKLLNPADGKGRAEGRFAFIDLLVDGRWGGLITGDKVVIDFSPTADGVTCPHVVTMTRYKDLPGGDDKLSCAGTIDAYVRGSIGA